MAVTFKDYGPHNPIRVFTVTLEDAGEVAANTSEQESVTVTGIAATDILIGYNVDKFDAGLYYGNAYISAADTVLVEIANTTAGALTPTVDATYTFIVIKGA
jgi:hypothetical protein